MPQMNQDSTKDINLIPALIEEEMKVTDPLVTSDRETIE